MKGIFIAIIDPDRLQLREESEELVASFPIIGDSFEDCEPLLDANEEDRWKVDFFRAIVSPAAGGTIDL